jgi:GNAT superfamily N-acetyltransferase
MVSDEGSGREREPASAAATEAGSQPAIRTARPDEFTRLREIELASEFLFTEIGIGPFAEDPDGNHLAQAAIVFVAEDPPVGFASVDVVDDVAHVWQLSVLPSAGRRGIGTALMHTVADWARAEGFNAVTLTTFRDVPWNAPFYAKLGFEPLDALTPELTIIRQRERDIGDDDFGARIAMRRDLRPADP